tara:strand:+ start:1665 stop:2054 length:390 start_codon:yes stop_codon:yes gene_type:complete
MATKILRTWYIDKTGKIGIVEQVRNTITKDGYNSDWTSITEIKGVRVYAISKDTDIPINSLTTSYNQIPTQFHEAIVYKAIASGYKDPRNLDIKLAQYFDNEYLLAVKEGRKFGKSNYTDVGTIRPQDF